METIQLSEKQQRAIDRLSGQGFDIPKSKALPIDENTVNAVMGILDRMFPRHEWESSYSLKHIAERILGYYVSNGEFIKAAILSGRPFQVRGINALLK